MSEPTGKCLYPDVPVRESEIDRCLDTPIPGGSTADDWFLPHKQPKALENVRDVVRRMISPIVAEREFYRKHGDEWERTGMNALAAQANLSERLKGALEALEVLAGPGEPDEKLSVAHELMGVVYERIEATTDDDDPEEHDRLVTLYRLARGLFPITLKPRAIQE